MTALIVADEVSAESLRAVGAIDIICNTCKNLGCGSIPIAIILVVTTSRTTSMGPTGVPFYAWIPLTVILAPDFGVPIILMAMQLRNGIARSMLPPISAVTLACVGRMENRIPADTAERCFIPMLFGMISMLIDAFAFV